MDPNKHKFKQWFIVALTLFVVGAGWLGAFVIRTFWLEHYVATYPFIPFFFFLCGMAFVALAHRAEQRGENMVRAFLALKAARIVASIVILGLYAWLGSGRLFDFAVTYLVFYVLYMIFEMIALSRYQRHETQT